MELPKKGFLAFGPACNWAQRHNVWGKVEVMKGEDGLYYVRWKDSYKTEK